MIKKVDPRTFFLVNTIFCIAAFLLASPQSRLLCFLLAFTLTLFFGHFRPALKSLAVYACVFAADFFIGRHAAQLPAGLAALRALIIVFYIIFPLVMMSGIFYRTINTSRLIASLKKMRLPHGVILSISVAFRYLPTIRSEIRHIRESMFLRGIDPRPANILKRPGATLEYALAPLLFRSLKIAEELTASALTRGVEAAGRRSFYFEARFGGGDLFVVLYIFLGLLVVSLAPPFMAM